MTTLKLTVSELEDLTIEGESTTEAGVELRVVKDGRWVSEGKFESKTVIFTDGERHYRGEVMREGSPFTDYTWAPNGTVALRILRKSRRLSGRFTSGKR